ncbi:MAG: iron-only hydrogenase system regulator [Oscillospiraceae bacterium]|nr:iron-only hydrogenase system regulator [Oscillospiraceae bacterium]
MDNTCSRVAIIGIIVDNNDPPDELNSILHNYSEYIIGRMGIPYKKSNIGIISIAVDAPETVISAMSGKIGRLPGISTKTLYSKVKNIT